jgi:hypothetical protein
MSKLVDKELFITNVAELEKQMSDFYDLIHRQEEYAPALIYVELDQIKSKSDLLITALKQFKNLKPYKK